MYTALELHSVGPSVRTYIFNKLLSYPFFLLPPSPKPPHLFCIQSVTQKVINCHVFTYRCPRCNYIEGKKRGKKKLHTGSEGVEIKNLQQGYRRLEGWPLGSGLWKPRENWPCRSISRNRVLSTEHIRALF